MRVEPADAFKVIHNHQRLFCDVSLKALAFSNTYVGIAPRPNER